MQEASAQTIAAELTTQARQQLAHTAHATPPSEQSDKKESKQESKGLNHAQKLMQFNPKKAAADMR